ncbi:glycoside hydrolase family 97 protein [Chitinophagaceae bacterium 26-R-25]|nr:glycoside hydrolase family 97 protein [Chitinophagaceae bacterium 26-R-25]
MAQKATTLNAGMDRVKLEFVLNESGTPNYAVYFNQKQIVKPSSLGFALSDDSMFYKDFELLGSEKKTVDETWKPVWGEVNQIRNNYEELTVHLKHKGATSRYLDIVFRVFADGVGFRYVFPNQAGLKYFIVTNEFTHFNLTGDHKAFWIPGDYDTNEYPYTTSKLSEVDAWKLATTATDIAVRDAPDQYAVQTPLMMKTSDGLYINIHEAALSGYPAMQLHVDRSSSSLSSNLVPDAVGNKAFLHAPFKTPWRTIIVSDKAADILASKLILNLNDPSVIQDPSWIKPMKFVGVWWEMQIGKSTWRYSEYADSTDANDKLIPNGRHGANTENVKRYIDFASKNGIGGVLVEGWNTGWEDWFGNWKEDVFDFVTPYPDFDLKEITAYAASRNVKMIMHNETSGSATNYERQMDTAFRFMNKFGYTSVKTGYVGKIIPRGEHHDGQWMVNHYERVAKKGVEYKVMVDMHEPPRPTGMQRTYPNWLACEAGRGNEYNAFSKGNAPEHETIMPFTRLMGGPMDYTPGIFKLKNYSPEDPTRQVHTTLAKQMALYITMYSPVQMVSDLLENYEAKPDAFQFIKDVPVDWDDSKILEAEPGDYITIARKEKGKDNWFIGAITDENARTTSISLDFLDKGKKYIAIVYADGDKADWKDNPESYKIQKLKVDAKTKLNLKLAAGGGAAISIMPGN